jgi:tight adherence protein B
MQLLILAGVFFGTMLLIITGYALINRRELLAAEAARERLRAGFAAGGGTVSILRDDRSSDIALLNRLLTGRALTRKLAQDLAQAGSRRRVGEFVLGSIAAATIGLTFGQRIGPVPALALATIGLFAPYMYVQRQRARRLATIEEQFPEALDTLVNALRAGYSMQAGIEFVGRETPAPLGPEFARFYDEQRLGVDVRTALLNLQERVGTPDIKILVTSLLIQRETGGNPGEILTNIANLVRERLAFRRHVETLTADPKLSARVLAALPLAAFTVLLVLNPEFVSPLLTTSKGHLTLLYAGASVVLGYVVMMRIADVDM